MTLLLKIKKKAVKTFLNNIIVNNILIFFKKDYLITKWICDWTKWGFDEKLTLQENVGFSHHPLIQEYVNITHQKIKQILIKLVKPKGQVLDFGCGTGLYLNTLKNNFSLSGIDMNSLFLEQAKKHIPECKFYYGDFQTAVFENKFDAIYSVSVLQYIVPSNLQAFFDKAYDLLNDNGILLLDYSHALSKKDIYYSDLSFVRYSPALIEKKAYKFSIIMHSHFFDTEKKIMQYDKSPYFFPDSKIRIDTIQNSYLLVAQKKNNALN